MKKICLTFFLFGSFVPTHAQSLSAWQYIDSMAETFERDRNQSALTYAVVGASSFVFPYVFSSKDSALRKPMKVTFYAAGFVALGVSSYLFLTDHQWKNRRDSILKKTKNALRDGKQRNEDLAREVFSREMLYSAARSDKFERYLFGSVNLGIGTAYLLNVLRNKGNYSSAKFAISSALIGISVYQFSFKRVSEMIVDDLEPLFARSDLGAAIQTQKSDQNFSLGFYPFNSRGEILGNFALSYIF